MHLLTLKKPLIKYLGKSYGGLKKTWVDEWAIRVIQGMYTNARSRSHVNGQYSEEFSVDVQSGIAAF